MIVAFVMAMAVRYHIDHFKKQVPGASAQLVIGAAAGSVIYAVIILLTEAKLVRELLDLVRSRNSTLVATATSG
jgi:succinoglycan exporter